MKEVSLILLGALLGFMGTFAAQRYESYQTQLKEDQQLWFEVSRVPICRDRTPCFIPPNSGFAFSLPRESLVVYLQSVFISSLFWGRADFGPPFLVACHFSG